MPDALLLRAQQGDRSAFEALYRATAGRVYALCLRLAGGDEGLARELVQDTFVRAWERLAGFRGEAPLTGWLHRIAVNELYQRRRAEKRRRARVQPMAEPPEVPGRRTADPLTRLDLEAALRTLPDGAREVFVLHALEGYTHEEIGGLLGVAVGTSKAHLHRARRLLREALDP